MELAQRAQRALNGVHDWGVTLGDEADALSRRDLLRVYPPLEPASPEDRLGEVGPDLPWALSHRILAAGQTVVPRLLAILDAADPPDEDSAPSWAAVHAASLLADRGVADAVRPAIRLLSICEPYLQQRREPLRPPAAGLRRQRPGAAARVSHRRRGSAPPRRAAATPSAAGEGRLQTGAGRVSDTTPHTLPDNSKDQ